MGVVWSRLNHLRVTAVGCNFIFGTTGSNQLLLNLELYAVAAEGGETVLNIVVGGYQNMNSLRPPAIDQPVQQVSSADNHSRRYLHQNQINKVDLMKVDAEGGEIQIFNCAKTLLSLFPPSRNL